MACVFLINKVVRTFHFEKLGGSFFVGCRKEAQVMINSGIHDKKTFSIDRVRDHELRICSVKLQALIIAGKVALKVFCRY